jgi:hypothetical protein
MHLLSFTRRLTAAALIIASASAVHAQNRGQYILGAAGLNAGLQAPAGLTVGTFYLHYEADAAKDSRGQNLPVDGRYTLDGGELLLAYTTPWKVLGANYGAAVVLFYMRGQLSLETFGISGGAPGFADSYVEPINLGWTFRSAAVKAAYGFIAPTGEDGVTTDFFGHDFTLGATFFLDEQKLNQFSLNSVTELHQKKRETDLKVGDNTQLELGAGRIIPLNGGGQLLQIGIVGYGQWQFTDDSGDDAIPVLADRQDRVFAAGPEIGVILPRSQWNFVFRGEQELAARNRAEGFIIFTGVAKSF